MFWKMTAKLLLKAMIPLLILIGALNYMSYMKGGDPLAVWKKVGSNLLASVQSNVSSTASSLDDVKWDIQRIASPDSPSGTQVYAWKDEQGMMHYSSDKPTGVDARIKNYDANANVVQSFKIPEPEVKPVEPVEVQAAPVAPTNSGLSLPAGAASLPGIEGMDLQKLDEILKARQEMLDKY